MSDEINKTADWAPGTLDKTRKNIGNIDEKEAASMAKKLGGQVLYERTTTSGNDSTPNRAGRIVRNSPGGGNGGSGGSSGSSGKNGSSSGATGFAAAPKRHIREELPPISKKLNASIDKLMMSSEYKIKPNYGIFNFLRTLQKNGTEKILPEFSDYKLKKDIEHLEAFTTVIKTLIQIAPATYKAKIVNGTETKFKFLRMIAAWAIQPIKVEYATLDSAPKPLLTQDLIAYTRTVYKPLITIYYYGANKIPKVIKEIYSDEAAYPESPKDKLSVMAKQAITEWLYIENEIIKKLYPLLMRMCSDTYEPYPNFFSEKVADILKFTGLHKFDLLLPEKPKEEEKKPAASTKSAPPQKGIKDQTVITGLKILNQMFPKAGFDRLDEHPDLYPYFQPLYHFADGFNLIAPDNPMQTVVVLMRIIEDSLLGLRNIKFVIPDNTKNNAETILNVLDDWSGYREDSFERLYSEPLCDLANAVYSQPDYDKSHIGKKTITALLWQVTYQFLPNFKFDQLVLEHPQNESKFKPLFHRTDFARKYLTLAINECDAVAKERGNTKIIQNPWEHYKFAIPNEVSKRLDVLLGAQNKTANTNANNANLLKYTLCFISVLDWYINNPGSPAYTTDPMHIYRISPEDGKPQFHVQERNDQKALFVQAVKDSYSQKAK